VGFVGGVGVAIAAAPRGLHFQPRARGATVGFVCCEGSAMPTALPGLPLRQKNARYFCGAHARCPVRGRGRARGSFRPAPLDPPPCAKPAAARPYRGIGFSSHIACALRCTLPGRARRTGCTLPPCENPAARKQSGSPGFISGEGGMMPTTSRAPLSGSPRPSRGCLPGQQEAGSTKPRPPERERGLRLRLWSLVWSLLGNRCHSRAKPARAPDCKSAIVGSTPTGASFFSFVPRA
jgi:hypothetical protein